MTFSFLHLFTILLHFHQTLSTPLSSPQFPLPQDSLIQPPAPVCNCTGTKPGDHAGYICSDERLGPVEPPRVMPMLSFVNNYDRFGGLTPGGFLGRWTFPENGSYRYPPGDGFSLDVDGKPIRGNITLGVGTKVDRFGSERGMFTLSHSSFAATGSIIRRKRKSHYCKD